MKNHKANQLLHVMQVVRHPKIKGRKILPFLPAQKCSQTKKTQGEVNEITTLEKKNSKMLEVCFSGGRSETFFDLLSFPQKIFRLKFTSVHSKAPEDTRKILMGWFSIIFAPPDQQKNHAENQSFGSRKLPRDPIRKTPAFQYAFPIEHGGFYSQSC